ncbi:MAG TPA: hypothetical protein VKB88_38410, partial [Bryobacteraceae bacterium]|nr:hypothetical protein [Bryobacteraceae bacterium]
YELLGKAFDQRISGLAKRIASMGGDGETLDALLHEFAKDMVEFHEPRPRSPRKCGSTTGWRIGSRSWSRSTATLSMPSRRGGNHAYTSRIGCPPGEPQEQSHCGRRAARGKSFVRAKQL